MSNFRTLLRQSSHYFMGRGFSLAIGFISFPIYARLFSVADYGVLNLAQRFTLFAVAVGKLGMQNAILRLHEEASSSEDSLNRLYSTSFYTTLGGALVCAILCAAFFFWAPSSWIQTNVASALVVSCGLIFVRCMMSPIYGFMRVESRTMAYNTVDALGRLLSLVCGAAMVLFIGNRVENLLLGLILAEGLVVVIALVSFVPLHRLRLAYFDSTVLRSSLLFAVPLAGSELVQTLLGSADRALVQYYLGSEPLGYYAAACAMAINLQEGLQIPLNLALVPIYVKMWHTQGAEETSRFVGRILDLFLMAACAITAIVFAGSRELIIIISSAKYAPAAPMLGPLVAGYMVFAATVFLSVGFWVQKRTIEMARLVLVAFVVKCVLNVILLPRLGLAGAVIPNIAGFVVMTLLYGWFSHRLLPIPISASRCLTYVAAAVLAALAAQQVSLNGLLPSLLAHCTISVSVYGVALWVLDPRIRYWTKMGLDEVSKRLKSA